MPLNLRAIIMRKIPTAADNPIFKLVGIALIIFSLIPDKVKIRKMIPDQKTAPKLCCQLKPNPRIKK